MNIKRAPEPFPQDTPTLSLVYIYPGLHIPDMNTKIYIYKNACYHYLNHVRGDEIICCKRSKLIKYL